MDQFSGKRTLTPLEPHIRRSLLEWAGGGGLRSQRAWVQDPPGALSHQGCLPAVSTTARPEKPDHDWLLPLH